MLTLSMFVALVSAPAAQGFELRSRAPSQCPSDAEVRASIEQQLGRGIASPLGDGLRVELDAAAQADGRWRVVLSIEGPEGTARRELGDASDCAAAVQAAALVIAIAIDPQLALAVPEPPPDADTEPAPTPEPTAGPAPRDDDLDPSPEVAPPGDGVRADAARAADARPIPRPRTQAVIGVAPVLSIGDVPAPGGHGRVWLGVLQRRWRVEVGGSVGGGPTRSSGDARIGFLRWTAQLRGCPVFTPRGATRLELLACAGLDAGQTRVRVRRLPSSAGADRSPDPWIAPVLAAGLVWRPRPAVGLRVGLELAVPVIRRSYEVLGAAPVFATASVVGAAFVGVEGRFP